MIKIYTNQKGQVTTDQEAAYEAASISDLYFSRYSAKNIFGLFSEWIKESYGLGFNPLPFVRKAFGGMPVIKYFGDISHVWGKLNDASIKSVLQGRTIVLLDKEGNIAFIRNAGVIIASDNDDWEQLMAAPPVAPHSLRRAGRKQ